MKTSACDVEDLGHSLGGEDPLEKGMATRSSILARRIPWTEEPGGLQSMPSPIQPLKKSLLHPEMKIKR